MILALLILLYFINAVCSAFLRKTIGTNASLTLPINTEQKKKKIVLYIAVATNRLVRNKTIAFVI